MKKLSLFLCFLICCLFVANGQYTVTIPENSSKYINDYAGILNEEQIESLATISKEQEQKSTAQIVVVITNDIPEDYPIFDYAQELFTHWGIGQKESDNGVLIVVCPNNRKGRVHVGYGLEGILTDAFTSTAQREYMVPYFKQGDYFRGLQNLMLAIVKQIDPETQAQLAAMQKQKTEESKIFWSNFWTVISWIIFGIVAIGIIIYSIKKRRQKEREKEEAERERQEKIRQAEIRRAQDEARRLRIEKENQEKIKKLTFDIKKQYEQKKEFLTTLKNENFLDAAELLYQLLLIESQIENYTSIAKIDDIEKYHTEFIKKFSLITSQIEHKWEIHNLVQKTHKEITQILASQETTLQSHLNQIKFLTEKHGVEIWDYPCVNTKLNPSEFKSYWSQIIKNLEKHDSAALSNTDYDIIYSHVSKSTLILKDLIDTAIEIHQKPSQITEAQEFFSKNLNGALNSLIWIKGLLDSADVNSQTKSSYNTYAQSIDLKTFSDESLCILERQILLKNFLDQLQKFKKQAEQQIENKAEEERLRQRRIREEQEEEERRRRREEDSYRSSYDSSSSSSYSSSYSSYDSGSSNNSCDSGGGSSGGGGSDSNW